MAAFLVRTVRAGEWRDYRALRLRALADSPAAFGATLEEALSRPEAAWAERLRAAGASELELPLLAEADGESAGMAWGSIPPAARDTAHLYQMWVAPSYRGLGIGQALVAAVIAWARGQRVAQVRLSVTRDNGAAGRLYAAAGFVADGPLEPLRPGSVLVAQPMRLVLDDPAPGRVP